MGFVPQQKPINARGDAMSRIVPEIVYCENQIHQFFLNQKIGSLLKRSNIDKEKGICPVSVFRVLFTLVFAGKNTAPSMRAEAAAWPRTWYIGFSTRSMPIPKASVIFATILTHFIVTLAAILLALLFVVMQVRSEINLRNL